jgi:hypothetical protein
MWASNNKLDHVGQILGIWEDSSKLGKWTNLGKCMAVLANVAKLDKCGHV